MKTFLPVHNQPMFVAKFHQLTPYPLRNDSVSDLKLIKDKGNKNLIPMSFFIYSHMHTHTHTHKLIVQQMHAQPQKRNTIGKEYCLEYSKVPKMFFMPQTAQHSLLNCKQEKQLKTKATFHLLLLLFS